MLIIFDSTGLKWIKPLTNSYWLFWLKFVPELHLKQPGFTYSVCGLFTIYRQISKKFRETCNLIRLYRNLWDKNFFTHDGTYSDLEYVHHHEHI